MPPEVLALFAGTCGAAVLAWPNARALAWLSVATAAFIFSYGYAIAGGAYHVQVTAACDTAQVLALYFWGKRRWEMLLWRVWQTSLLLSLLHLAGWTGGQFWYAVGLEACNWAALLVIGGGAIAARLADDGGLVAHPLGSLHRALRALRAQRGDVPFHRAGW